MQNSYSLLLSKSSLTLILTILATCLISGCATVQPAPEVPDISEAPGLYMPRMIEEYRIQAGDSLAIRSYYNPELNQELLVRPDGRISIMLIGDVAVAGMTPTELNTLVAKKYKEVIDSSEVTVIMTDMPNRRIYVGGEVKAPSVIPLDTSMTVLQAVSAAGGFLPSGDKNQILLMRKQDNGSITTLKFDVEDVINNTSPGLYLTSNDIVYVPKTSIANAGEFVDMYINNIIPDAILLNFTFLTDLHRKGTTIDVD